MALLGYGHFPIMKGIADKGYDDHPPTWVYRSTSVHGTFTQWYIALIGFRVTESHGGILL